MSSKDIASEHQDVKKTSYWDNLVECGTATYKERKISELLASHGPKNVESIIDIGCGTCELIFHYKKSYGAKNLTCMDYDKKVIDFLAEKYPTEQVNWLVADVFDLDKSNEKYNVCFLLDMIHEVYSFYGRPDRNIQQQVNHELGLKSVNNLIANVVSVISPEGAIVITDNLLCEERVPVTVKLKNAKVVEAVQFFVKNYPTRALDLKFIDADKIVIDSRDFCILLTQYNKIKKLDWDRWNVEKMEIHQYFTLKEYQEVFGKHGFEVFSIVETPEDAAAEWNEDFEVISGLPELPKKRATILARKK